MSEDSDIVDRLRWFAEQGKLRLPLQAVVEIDALRRKLSESEKACLEVIDERDRFEEQIGKIAAEFGLGKEWSNNCDLGEECIEAAKKSRAVARGFIEANAELGRLRSKMAIAERWLDEISRPSRAPPD